jgi:phospholipid/cholesterol/gamma-HCH transport system substrate-binding protein
MASVKTNFAVGLFVIIGFAIALTAILWLGMSHVFEKGRRYAAYFDESVQGLDKDSTVKYRGVGIGRVEQIRVAPDGRLIEVILIVESDLELGPDIVAQLKMAGITGKVFIELDHRAHGEEDLSPRRSFPTKYNVIATKPSQIKRLFDSLDEALKQISALDLAGISEQALQALDDFSGAVQDLDTHKISVEINNSLQVWNNALNAIKEAAVFFKALTLQATETFATAEGTLHRVDGVIDANEQQISAAVSELNQAIKEADRVVANTARLVAEGTRLVQNTDRHLYRLMQHLQVTLQNAEKASDALNRSLQEVSEQPSQLLFGEPPPPRPLESPVQRP